MGNSHQVWDLFKMRKTYALVCLIWAFPLIAPMIPSLPPVTDDRRSIRRYVGAMSNRYPTCRSNIMIGIAREESRINHRYKTGPKRGKIVKSRKGALGVFQVMPIHGRAMKLDLYTIDGNIEAAYRVFNNNMKYYAGKGYKGRQRLLRAIQAFWGGYRGRLKYRERARKYMHHVLHYAEGKPIPRKYRWLYAYNGIIIEGMAKAISESDLGGKIKSLLDGKSCSQLAADLGVSQPYLLRVINGERNIGDKLARALGFKRIKMNFYKPISGKNHTVRKKKLPASNYWYYATYGIDVTKS